MSTLPILLPFAEKFSRIVAVPVFTVPLLMPTTIVLLLSVVSVPLKVKGSSCLLPVNDVDPSVPRISSTSVPSALVTDSSDPATFPRARCMSPARLLSFPYRNSSPPLDVPDAPPPVIDQNPLSAPSLVLVRMTFVVVFPMMSGVAIEVVNVGAVPNTATPVPVGSVSELSNTLDATAAPTKFFEASTECIRLAVVELNTGAPVNLPPPGRPRGPPMAAFLARNRSRNRVAPEAPMSYVLSVAIRFDVIVPVTVTVSAAASPSVVLPVALRVTKFGPGFGAKSSVVVESARPTIRAFAGGVAVTAPPL